MKCCQVTFVCVFLVACDARAPVIEIRVEKAREHPMLVDHERVLTVMVDGERIDSTWLHPDGGDGAPLHYVESADEITVVDCNGVWYHVTRNGIENLGWRWEHPLPQGIVKRISLDGVGRYVTTTPGGVKRADIYKYKIRQANGDKSS